MSIGFEDPADNLFPSPDAPGEAAATVKNCPRAKTVISCAGHQFLRIRFALTCLCLIRNAFQGTCPSRSTSALSRSRSVMPVCPAQAVHREAGRFACQLGPSSDVVCNAAQPVAIVENNEDDAALPLPLLFLSYTRAIDADAESINRRRILSIAKQVAGPVATHLLNLLLERQSPGSMHLKAIDDLIRGFACTGVCRVLVCVRRMQASLAGGEHREVSAVGTNAAETRVYRRTVARRKSPFLR